MTANLTVRQRAALRLLVEGKQSEFVILSKQLRNRLVDYGYCTYASSTYTLTETGRKAVTYA